MTTWKHSSANNIQSIPLVVRLGRDRADIMIGPAVIRFRMTKPGFYIGTLHGLEFTMKAG